MLLSFVFECLNHLFVQFDKSDEPKEPYDPGHPTSLAAQLGTPLLTIVVLTAIVDNLITASEQPHYWINISDYRNSRDQIQPEKEVTKIAGDAYWGEEDFEGEQAQSEDVQGQEHVIVLLCEEIQSDVVAQEAVQGEAEQNHLDGYTINESLDSLLDFVAPVGMLHPN